MNLVCTTLLCKTTLSCTTTLHKILFTIYAKMLQKNGKLLQKKILKKLQNTITNVQKSFFIFGKLFW